MNKQNKIYERSLCKLRGVERNIAGAQKRFFTVPEVRAGLKEAQEAVDINPYLKLKKLAIRFYDSKNCILLQTNIAYMEKLKYLLLLILATTIYSYSNNETQDKLNDISTYVCSNPDSARKELDGINKSELTTEQLRAHHALLSCESEYFSRREIKNSTLNVASKYFIDGKNGTTSQQMETELLCLYKEIYNKPAETLAKLLSMEKNIDNLSSPHYKAMLESFLLTIYYNNHEYEKMLEYSYKELEYAKEGNIASKIINSNIHIGTAYKNMNKLDSAYIYYSSFKKYENILDSTILSVAYHNMAVLQKYISTADKKNIIVALQNSLKYNTEREDSARTYLLIAQHYFNIREKEKADSFLNIFYKSIRKNDYDSYYNISKTLNNYYEQTGNIDSANKYKGEMLKYRIKRDSAIRASRVTEITHQSEIDNIEQQSQEKTVTVAVASTVVVVGLASMLFLYRRKKVKLGLDYADNVRKLEGTLAELEEARVALRNAQEKQLTAEAEMEASKEVEQLKQEVKKASENSKKLKDTTEQHCIKILTTIFKNGGRDFKAMEVLTEGMYPAMNDAYRTMKGGRRFLDSLTEECKTLSNRDIFVCILYHEGVTDENVISGILHTTVKTFRTMKSRLKKKLEDAPECETAKEIIVKMTDENKQMVK